MDEVEWLLPEPGLFDVIDFEAAVGWNPVWLDGTEVDADYMGFGVCAGSPISMLSSSTYRGPELLSHVNCPEPCACP